jgi:hypothetical protein
VGLRKKEVTVSYQTEKKRWKKKEAKDKRARDKRDVYRYLSASRENDCSRILGADGMASDLQQNNTSARTKTHGLSSHSAQVARTWRLSKR